MNIKVSIIIPVYNVEKYIEKMLKSVKEQSFTDFEVIIINDGSTDNSQKIINRFCDEDQRFKSYVQENAGVSGARNKGLEIAQGKYVVFYDPDDYIPENALHDMYYTAKEENADLVVGIMRVINISDEYLTGSSKQLAAKKKIDKFDTGFNWNFSVCNKLFRLDLIQRYNLMFKELTHGEDGVFLFSYIHSCEKISGCKNVVYDYIKRAPWESRSATQLIRKDSLRDIFHVCDLITSILEQSNNRLAHDIKDKYGEDSIYLSELECRYREARSDLFCRFVSLSLLGEYYRFVWEIDNEMCSMIADKVREYKEKIFPSHWENIVLKKNKDLLLNRKLLLTQEEILESPLMTFVISAGVSKDNIEKVLACIYNQNSPSFKVLVDNTFEDYISDVWKNKLNFKFTSHYDNTSEFKKAVMRDINSDYVSFIDENIFLPMRVIKSIYDKILVNNELGNKMFVTLPIKTVSSNEWINVESHRTVFVNELVKKRIRSPYNQLDCIWGNKIFNVRALKAKKVLFTGNAWNDMNRLYNNSSYVKWLNLSMGTTLTSDDLLKKVKNIRVKTLYKFKINQDIRRKRKIEKYDERIVSMRQVLKNWKLRNMRNLYRLITRKIIFPIQYRRYCRKPVDKSKVIFIEPRLADLTNSMLLIRESFAGKENFKIKEYYLRLSFSRYRQQFRKTMSMVKDMATAKYVVIAEANEIIGCLNMRKETVVLQTWHGCGAFKKFGFSTAELLFGDNEKKKNRFPAYRNFSLVTVSSPEVVWAYEEAMRIKDKNIIKPLGISRTDVFFDEKYVLEAKLRIEKLVPATKEKKVIIYAPTFRERVSSAKAPDRLDIECLAKALSDEYVLLIKHHPLVKKIPEIPAEYRDIFAYDVTKSASIEDLICSGDICISDYSSLIFEYSLFDRPMIFFAYDLDEYFDWRGFYYDYDELAPGPVVSNTEEIVDFIKNIDSRFDKQRVINFRQKFMNSCDGHATERIMEEIMKM